MDVLDAENFGANSKYVKTFVDVAQNGTTKYKDNIGTIHIQFLIFQKVPSC